MRGLQSKWRGPIGWGLALAFAFGVPSAAWAKDRKPTFAKKVRAAAAAPGAARVRPDDPPARPGERRVAKRRRGDLRIAPELCITPEVTFLRGSEKASGPLVDCKGAAVVSTLESLSVLARLRGAPRPSIEDGSIVAVPGNKREGEASRGVKRLDPGVLVRLSKVAAHYPDKVVYVVSGYRPQSAGSLHQHGRALDIQVQGVDNVELVAFCRTLKDTGCGYYPNSHFVHVDVRKPGTGSVSWIDASGPGEAPRYVKSWPPPEEKKDDPPKVPPDTAPDPAKHPAPVVPAAELPDLPAAS